MNDQRITSNQEMKNTGDDFTMERMSLISDREEGQWYQIKRGTEAVVDCKSTTNRTRRVPLDSKRSHSGGDKKKRRERDHTICHGSSIQELLHELLNLLHPSFHSSVLIQHPHPSSSSPVYLQFSLPNLGTLK